MKIKLSIIILALVLTLSACGKGTDGASEKAKQESASSVIVKKSEKDEKKDKSKDSISALSENIKTAKEKKDENKPSESSNNIKTATNVAKPENSPNGSTSTSSTQNSGSSYTANDDANYATKEEPVDEEKDEPKHEPKPKPVYVDKWIPEEGHYETVVIKEAWSEEKPIYEQQRRRISNDTGEDWTDLTEDELEEAMGAQLEAGGCGSWSGKYIDVQVGTETIYHEAVTEDKWVVDVPGHYETVLDHYE